MSFTSPFGRLILPAASAVADALFPPSCPVCRAETARPGSLCGPCWRGIRFLSGKGCGTCGRDLPALGAADPASSGAPIRCDSCIRHPPRWERG
ncbi:MAG: hypothetical protein D6729_01445, partial [Deltaproteobacteria bacterium]